MSKSLGNGIDPLEVIDKYGADALTILHLLQVMHLVMICVSTGKELRQARNFANKVWNASRFIMMNILKKADAQQRSLIDLTAADKWILSKVNTLAKEVTDNMDKLRAWVSQYPKLYDFIWEEFCDWYIEMVKPRSLQ